MSVIWTIVVEGQWGSGSYFLSLVIKIINSINSSDVPSHPIDALWIRLLWPTWQHSLCSPPPPPPPPPPPGGSAVWLALWFAGSLWIYCESAFMSGTHLEPQPSVLRHGRSAEVVSGWKSECSQIKTMSGKNAVRLLESKKPTDQPLFIGYWLSLRPNATQRPGEFTLS